MMKNALKVSKRDAPFSKKFTKRDTPIDRP